MMILATQDALGQVRRYRIELLVLTHLNPPADVVPETELRDFSASLDLQNPPPEAPEEVAVAGKSEKSLAVTAADGTAAPITGDTATEASGIEAEDPRAVVWLETPSETMDQAWRRLRSSSGFRPEVYFSWEQSNEQPFPLLRVHDATLLFEEDPFAELRALAASSPQPPPLNASAESEEEVIPEPLRFYRIDGTASLRKTRFLHLDLDLQLRVPMPGTDPGLAEPELSRTSMFEIFPIRQSRRIQTRNIEYFDGPVVAVLALISRVDPDPAEADPDVDNSGDIASEVMPQEAEHIEPTDTISSESDAPQADGEEEQELTD